MPLLRRPDAHHRDLPARAETDVARTTKGAGRMTNRLSSVTEHHRLHPADPARTRMRLSISGATRRRQSRQNAQLCRHHRPSLRPSQAPCTPSAAPLMQPSPQPSAHFPHSTDPRPPRLPPWEVFQRGSWSRQSATFRRDPHQKTFTKAAVRQPPGCCGAGRRRRLSPR